MVNEFRVSFSRASFYENLVWISNMKIYLCLWKRLMKIAWKPVEHCKIRITTRILSDGGCPEKRSPGLKLSHRLKWSVPKSRMSKQCSPRHAGCRDRDSRKRQRVGWFGPSLELSLAMYWSHQRRSILRSEGRCFSRTFLFRSSSESLWGSWRYMERESTKCSTQYHSKDRTPEIIPF